MDFFSAYGLTPANGICYSGFRDGQAPGVAWPQYEEVKEDLEILQGDWKYLRLYDCDPHAQTVLEVIRKEQMDFKVMLGAYIVAEVNNPHCPWGGGIYPQEQLLHNQQYNQQRIQTLINWANTYPDIVFSLAVGNEACVSWTDHLVPVEKVVAYARQVKEQAKQPVTFCENYVPWLSHLQPLAAVLDFISIHTYPLWEYQPIEYALDYTKKNVEAVATLYPQKHIAITEAGWATRSNGRGMHAEAANTLNQQLYHDALMQWAQKQNLLTFYFEAFDENWKGSPDPLEPEKHWGLYDVQRRRKW